MPGLTLMSKLPDVMQPWTAEAVEALAAASL
jgi:hypothetical protein